MKKILMAFIAASFLFSCNSEKKEDKDSTDKSENTSSGNSSMEEKNKAVALASINAMMAGDIEGVLKDVATDGSAVDYGDGSKPPVKGVDSIRAFLSIWRGSLSEFKADNIWAIAEGDHVAVFGDWSGTYKTDFMGMKLAGKSFRAKDCDIFKFNSEGKMVEHRSVQSFGNLFASLLAPTPD